jgi:hypothetical protein
MRNTHSVRLSLDLVIQHEMRVRHLLSLACPALHCFYTFLIKGMIVEKRIFEYKLRVLIFSTFV